MLNRESKFPRASNNTYIRRASGRDTPGRKRRGPLFPVLFILLLALGLYIYGMPSKPWEPYLERLQNLLSDRQGKRDPPKPTPSSATNKVEPVKSPPPDISPEATRPQSDQILATPIQLDISIGMGFRPVGFKIGAVSQAISLSKDPGKRLRRLPTFTSFQQRYGVIRLAHGQEYGFALDLAAAGFRMFIDRNRNGDLRDDGEPLVNQGKSLFASRLQLPLAQVSGIQGLKGDYQLWVFTNPGNWKNEKMLYYSMTQMRGELLLEGKRYTAFLADNGPVDGDYRNDGISIDMDGDGKIDRRTEFFPQGKDVLIGGVSYSFRVTR